MEQRRPAGMERCEHRCYAWAGGNHSDERDIQSCTQVSEGRRDPLRGAIIADMLEELRREGVGHLVGRCAPLPHVIQLSQDSAITHALKVRSIAPLPLPCCWNPLTEGIAHGGAGQGPPSYFHVRIYTDPDILHDLYLCRVSVGPHSALGNPFSAPGDLLWCTPVQAHAIGQLPGKA